HGVSRTATTASFTFYPYSSGMSSFYADKEEEKTILKAIISSQQQKHVDGIDEVAQYTDELLEGRFKAETFTCQLRPLAEIIAEQRVERIDLLKIDVQKSELDVLHGLAADDWRKIRQIVMEVHDLDGRLQEVTELLERHGFTITVEQDDIHEGTILYNLFAVKSGDRDAHVLPSTALATGELRGFLREKLPEYMVPALFVPLRSMPLTPNGKIDRKALPTPDRLRHSSEAAYVAPQSEAEQAIAGIWRDVLQLERVGIEDNFFDVGGHSLLMVQVQTRLQAHFNRVIPLITLFKYTTISTLAAFLSRDQAERPSFEESYERAETRTRSVRRQRELRQKARAPKQGDSADA
ncbi:MAG: FkbM family methyltransferase, partial [Chloroflexi bacterium]|nr:FkbM family methyltransferase [Chloroflexota bacterium]